MKHADAAAAAQDAGFAAASTRASADQDIEPPPREEADAEESTRAKPEEGTQEARDDNPKPRQSLPGICEHGRQRSRCKECDGSGVCEHQKLRHYCKQCGGSGICKHGRRKSDCKQCKGSNICEHGRQKRQCSECVAAYGACEHGKAKNRYCRQCGNGPFPSQSARARPKVYAIDVGACKGIAAAATVTAASEHEFAIDTSAAALPSPQTDVMQYNQMLQQLISGIPSPFYALPSAASIHAMPMMPMLPVPLATQGQHTFNLGMHVLAARANYASLAQQHNFRHAQYLQRQRSFGTMNALASGSMPGQPFGHLLGLPPFGQLQLATIASQLAANDFGPYP